LTPCAALRADAVRPSFGHTARHPGHPPRPQPGRWGGAPARRPRQAGCHAGAV